MNLTIFMYFAETPKDVRAFDPQEHLLKQWQHQWSFLRTLTLNSTFKIFDNLWLLTVTGQGSWWKFNYTDILHISIKHKWCTLWTVPFHSSQLCNGTCYKVITADGWPLSSARTDNVMPVAASVFNQYIISSSYNNVDRKGVCYLINADMK